MLKVSNSFYPEIGNTVNIKKCEIKQFRAKVDISEHEIKSHAVFLMHNLVSKINED